MTFNGIATQTITQSQPQITPNNLSLGQIECTYNHYILLINHAKHQSRLISHIIKVTSP